MSRFFVEDRDRIVRAVERRVGRPTHPAAAKPENAVMMTRASLALMIALFSALVPTPALAALVGLSGADLETAIVGIERERDIPPP
jgi:hypothetical protein